MTALSLFLIVCSNRISRLENNRLQKKLAEVKRSFIRFISHEVRTPLNVMKLGLDMVKSEMKDRHCSRESLDNLRDVRGSCNQAVHILNELLNFQKIEAGILSLDRLLLSAWDVLAGSLTSSEEMAKKMGVQLVTPTVGSNIANTLKTTMVHVDGEKLRQALEFILLSSVKSTARGGILTITASVTEGVIATAKTYSTEVQPILRLHISSSGAVPFALLKQGSVSDIMNRTMNLMNDSLQTEKNTGFTIEDARSIIEVHNGKLSTDQNNNNQMKNITIIELPAKIVASTNSYQIHELSARIAAKTTRIAAQVDSSSSLISKSFRRVAVVGHNEMKTKTNNNTMSSSGVSYVSSLSVDVNLNLTGSDPFKKRSIVMPLPLPFLPLMEGCDEDNTDEHEHDNNNHSSLLQSQSSITLFPGRLVGSIHFLLPENYTSNLMLRICARKMAARLTKFTKPVHYELRMAHAQFTLLVPDPRPMLLPLKVVSLKPPPHTVQTVMTSLGLTSHLKLLRNFKKTFNLTMEPTSTTHIPTITTTQDSTTHSIEEYTLEKRMMLRLLLQNKLTKMIFPSSISDPKISKDHELRNGYIFCVIANKACAKDWERLNTL
eukprot:gene3770-7481_t